MKAPLHPKTLLLLYDIPIFSIIVYLIFFQNTWLLNSVPYFIILLCIVAVIYVFVELPLPQKNHSQSITDQYERSSKHPQLISLLAILALMPVTFILLYTPYHFLIAMHPVYLADVSSVREYIQYGIMACTLLTVIFAKIINYFYYHTKETGWINNTIVKYFNTSPTFATTLELFLGFTTQTLTILYFVFTMLIITQLVARYCHIRLLSELSFGLIFICYVYFMLPKLTGWKKLLAFLQQKGWRTGYFYLLSISIGVFIWLIINLTIPLLPAKITQFFHGDGLLSLSSLPPKTAWLLFVISLSIGLSLLLASALARIQNNNFTFLNIPIALFYCLYVFFLQRIHLQISLTIVGQLICLLSFMAMIIISCHFMHGNQVNLIGFLNNKNNIKARSPVKYLIPSIQSILIGVSLYALGGIYILFFPIYLAIMPSLLIMIVTMILFPFLKERGF